jgi:TPP-dependent 2-oxoacid decarboxylase
MFLFKKLANFVPKKIYDKICQWNGSRLVQASSGRKFREKKSNKKKREKKRKKKEKKEKKEREGLFYFSISKK